MYSNSLVSVLLGHILDHFLFSTVVDVFLSHSWVFLVLGSQVAHFSLFDSCLSINVLLKVGLVEFEFFEHVLLSVGFQSSF